MHMAFGTFSVHIGSCKEKTLSNIHMALPYSKPQCRTVLQHVNRTLLYIRRNLIIMQTTTLSNHSMICGSTNSYLKIFGIQLCAIHCLQQCLDNVQLAASGSHVQWRTLLCKAASCISAVPPNTPRVSLKECTLKVT